VPKVKKKGRAASGRNTPVKGTKRPAAGRKPVAKKGPARKAGAKKKSSAKKSMAKTTTAKKLLKKVTEKPPAVMWVKELDPQQKCGPETSVQFLYRVDETVERRTTHHLVFFDQHGWYCEHGRTCPAVAHARKHNGQFARAS
jgi:hypothetical protein